MTTYPGRPSATAGGSMYVLDGDLDAYALLPDNEERAVGQGELLFNVKDYGAVGNGVANDRPAILLAVAAAEGGTLLFPPGTYNVSAAVGLIDNTTFMGQGATITQTGSGSVLSVSGLTGVRIEGFTLDGDGISSAALAIESSSAHITVTDCTVTGGTDYGCYVFNSSDITLDRVRATANGNGTTSDAGFYLNGTDVRVANCLADANTGSGFRIHGNSTSQGARITLEGCHAVSNTLHGFVGASSGGTQYGPQYVAVTDCQAHSNGNSDTYSGFAFHYLSRLNVSNVTAGGNAEHGIVFMDQEYVVAAGLYAHGNGKAGLRLQSDFSLAQNSRSGVRNSQFTGGLIAGNWTLNTADDDTLGAAQIDGTRKCRITDLMIVGNRSIAMRFEDVADYTDSSNVEVLFSAYDNTLGDTLSDEQAAGGIFGSYRNTSGVTTL